MARRLTALLAAAGLLATAARAQAPEAEPASASAVPAPATPALAADLHEEVSHLPVTVKDLYGRQETRPITLTSFHPAGEGPFPLVIMNHGRAPADRRALQVRQRYEALSRYLVSKGFAVLVPTRVGYGETYGDFDPESSGECQHMRPQAAAQAVTDEVMAVLAHAKTLPWVDTRRWVVMGQSMGGFTAIAVTAHNPPGLVAAINFSGGTGGNPELKPGNPCSPQAVGALWKSLAAGARVPMLWMYWQNDHYWGPDVPRQWAQDWRDGGGQVDFQQFPPAGNEGHQGLLADMDHWVPVVEAWLARAGFTRSGVVPRPPASDFARVAEIDKVPLPPAVRQRLYTRFLQAAKPRAFAIGPDGQAGYATGDWALGKALGFCQARRGGPCRLYAVDDDVVWTP